MKTQNLKYFVLVVSLLLSTASLNLMAQNEQSDESGKQRGKHWRSHRGGPDGQSRILNIPGLTDQQKTAIEKIRVQTQKEALPIRNEMREKRARLNTLGTADKADMNEINKVVGEIGDLQTQLMKNREMAKQQIRELLNDEQRLFFDTHKRGMHHFGDGNGRRGNGRHGRG